MCLVVLSHVFYVRSVCHGQVVICAGWFVGFWAGGPLDCWLVGWLNRSGCDRRRTDESNKRKKKRGGQEGAKKKKKCFVWYKYTFIVCTWLYTADRLELQLEGQMEIERGNKCMRKSHVRYGEAVSCKKRLPWLVRVLAILDTNHRTVKTTALLYHTQQSYIRTAVYHIWGHIEPAVRGVEVPHTASTDEFRRNPPSHSCFLFLFYNYVQVRAGPAMKRTINEGVVLREPLLRTRTLNSEALTLTYRCIREKKEHEKNNDMLIIRLELDEISAKTQKHHFLHYIPAYPNQGEIWGRRYWATRWRPISVSLPNSLPITSYGQKQYQVPGIRYLHQVWREEKVFTAMQRSILRFSIWNFNTVFCSWYFGRPCEIMSFLAFWFFRFSRGVSNALFFWETGGDIIRGIPDAGYLSIAQAWMQSFLPSARFCFFFFQKNGNYSIVGTW